MDDILEGPIDERATRMVAGGGQGHGGGKKSKKKQKRQQIQLQ